MARMYAVRSPGANASRAPVIDVHPVRRDRGQFVPVERGDGPAITDHVCAYACRFAGEVPASSSSKAASMSSRSNPTRAAIRSSASISTIPSNSVWNASGPWSSTEMRTAAQREALPAGRDDGRRCSLGPDVGDGPHVRDFDISTVSESPRPPPDGDRHCKCRRPASRPWRPNRGPRSKPRSARLLGLPRFPAVVPVGSARRTSRARRRGLPRRMISHRLTMSPSTVKRSTPRHSASKPSCEFPCAACVTTAPWLLSRCTTSG